MSRLRGRDHDRARSLAAERVDGALAPADAAWLDEHLAGCPACAADAAGFAADRDLLRGLRTETFEPPRDLWARTAAAIETESGARQGRRVFGVPAMTLAPIAGLAAVAVVVGSGLLNGQPVAPEGGDRPTPFQVAPGTVAVLNRTPDGGFQFQTGQLNEVCPITVDECRVEPSFEITAVPGIRPSVNVDAVISPKRDKLVVIPRDSGGTGGVYVVAVKTPAPDATAVANPTAPPTSVPTEAPTEAPTETPVETASPENSESPQATETPSGSPVESPSDTTASPEATPEPTATPKATEAPTATPVVVVTPRPDGALEIASGVIVVDGPASYSPDGTHFAFAARPADGSGGPDVYVWNIDETVARRVTDDHRSVFSGWDGADLLVSRVADGRSSTVRLDATTGEVRGQPVDDVWLPTLAPDGTHAVWWDGAVRLAEDGVSWVPGEGRLVVGSWPDGADAQPVTNGRVDAWQVGWDPSGEALAVWVAGKNADAGRLSLYRVDQATGRPNLAKPMLEDEPSLGTFTIEPSFLAWSAPGKERGKTVQVLGWKGDTIGRYELPADGDLTLVQQ